MADRERVAQRLRRMGIAQDVQQTDTPRAEARTLQDRVTARLRRMGVAPADETPTDAA
jgi:hypothetical protein